VLCSLEMRARRSRCWPGRARRSPLREPTSSGNTWRQQTQLKAHWLAPVGGPIFRGGTRGQVQPAHCGPHAGSGDHAWRLSFVLPPWRDHSSAGAGDVCAQTVAPGSRILQSPALAVPTEIRRTPGPPLSGADTPRTQIRTAVSDRPGGGALRSARSMCAGCRGLHGRWRIGWDWMCVAPKKNAAPIADICWWLRSALAAAVWTPSPSRHQRQ
jgi:hypothetical protein